MDDDDNDTHPPRIIVRVGMVFRRGQKDISFPIGILGKKDSLCDKGRFDCNQLHSEEGVEILLFSQTIPASMLLFGVPT